MKWYLLAICVLVVAACSSKFSPPKFNLDTARRVKVGYAIASDPAERIKAFNGGTVAYAERDASNDTNLGRFVVIEHFESILRKGHLEKFSYYSLCAMLGSISVEVGQTLNAGTPLGMPGPSGKLVEVENGANLLFAVFSSSTNEDIEARWGKPLREYGFYWYDVRNIIGSDLPAVRTKTP